MLKKRVADRLDEEAAKNIPEDCVIPLVCAYGEVVDQLVSGYEHNFKYGHKNGLVKEKDRGDHKYWFPFFFDYDFPLAVYMINLDPKAKPSEYYGVWIKYRETDYTAGSEGSFRVLKHSITERIIPNISLLH